MVGMTAGHNGKLLLEQAAEFRPTLVACADEVAANVDQGLPEKVRRASIRDVAQMEADVVVAAIPGFAGLEPTRVAVREGRRVALANKEAMVVAGPLVAEEARRHGATIVPVDSEHSALFQCLVGEDRSAVSSLVLTASGGPFLFEPADLDRVTPEQALKHPNWDMGEKVTVDSATLFNKGLEVLEAHFLFEMPLDGIEVVVHPQSLIHGLIRFKDGNIKAQLGPHDMRIPIQYAIEYPERPPTPLEPLTLSGTWQLLPPDPARFPALGLAFEAGRKGGVAPTAVNAADEVAVTAFLSGRLRFPGIARVIERVLADVPSLDLSWDAIADADAWAREHAGACIAASTAGR